MLYVILVKKIDVGPAHGIVHQSEGLVSYLTSSSPRGNARGRRHGKENMDT